MTGKGGWIVWAIAIALIALVLAVTLASCGRGKSRLGGRTEPGGGQAITTQNRIPPQVSRSVDEVIAEIKAYEPPASANVDKGLFETLRAELLAKVQEIASSRNVSSFPIRTASSGDRDDEVGLTIGDVFVIPRLDGKNEIVWNETLAGDFDGNFEVGVSDITPIALNYLTMYGAGYGNGANEESDRMLLYAQGYQTAAAASEPETEIGVSDITTIALNYLYTGPWGYDIWRIPLSGGIPERIPNPTDSDAPTVVRTPDFNQGTPKTYSYVDTLPAQPSSLRSASTITEDGDGWGNGDWYYYIAKRNSKQESAPNPPSAPKFNVHAKYIGPFHIDSGQDVTLGIEVFGDVTPVSYGINWGDSATDSAASSQFTHEFTHSFTQSGKFVPVVTVQGIPEGQSAIVFVIQEAPPVHVDSNLPWAPTDLRVDPTETGVHLSWGSDDPNATPEDVFRVYYSLRRWDSRPTFLGLTSGNTFDTPITEQLMGGMSIFFAVTCERNDAESSFSNEVKWPPSGIPAPNPLTLLGTSNETRVDLSWAAVPDGQDYTVTGYRVYKGLELGDPNPVLVSQPDPLPSTQTSYTYIPEPGEEVLYFFARTVADGGRTSGRSNEVVWQPTTPPQPPKNLTSSAGYRYIRVNWEASPSAGVSGYRVSYSPTDDPGNIKLFETTGDARSYTITNSGGSPVLNSKEYNLWVEAVRAGLYSGKAGPVTADPFNTAPTAGFVVDKTSGAAPLTVQFNASTGSPASGDPDGRPLTYDWDWGDGTAHGTGATPSHTYEDEGEFTPALTVTDEEGAMDDYTGATISTVPGAPTSVANANPQSGFAPLTVNFTATGSSDADGEIIKYEWQFFAGDDWHDYTPQGGDAAHTYNAKGTYTATLKVTDDSIPTGKVAYDSVQITVTNKPPVAEANANPTSGTKPLLVGFNATGSGDPDGTIVKWEWDWTSDGTYDWESNSGGGTNYTYTNHGDFTAKLRVTDDNGATGTDTVAIHVNAPPVAVLTADPTEGDPPLTVNFDASGSYDPDGTIVKYEWDWEGDGTYDFDSGTQATAQHTYDTGGSFTATLRVTDFNFAGSIDNVNIAVYGMNNEVVDSVGDVGGFASIAIDSNHRIHISYDDGTNGDLKYAYFDGVIWNITSVDTNGDVGYYTSIAVDSLGYPHICYTDNTNLDLKYCKWNGASWNIETIDSAGDVGGQKSIKIDSDNYPHISYQNRTTDDLKYAHYNGISWNITTVDSTGIVGEGNSLALDSQNRPHISYHFYDAKDLKYAFYNGSSWIKETVDSDGDFGEFTAIAVDSTDRPHIAYLDRTSTERLKYAWNNGEQWSFDIIDEQGGTGFWVSMELDSAGNARVGYRDEWNKDLKYARFTDPGWNNVVVDGAGEIGLYGCSIALDSDNYPHFAYYDGSNANLKHAWYGLPN
ncbi:MAG: PKD domain-containing protein [bacterium]|jgi:PKD repeat protein